MKQKLPLLDSNAKHSPESQKTVILREDTNLINKGSESKNLNILRQKYIRKPTKFSIDSKEAQISSNNNLNNFNYNSNPNYLNNINENNNKSAMSKLDLNGYRKVNLDEERLENLGGGMKINTTLVSHATKETISKEQMAFKISLEDIKRKNEELKKQIELKKSKAFYKFRAKLENIIESNYFVIFFMLLTIFIMFIADIQNGWLPVDSDDAIDALQTTILVLFVIEIVLSCIAKEGYANSFFFWLDVVSTISIVQDIGFIFDPLLNLGSVSSVSEEMFAQLNQNSTDIGANKSLKNVNQALGKITAVSRITRILRIIRVIRLIRIVKLYKNAMLARENILKRRKEKQRNSKKSILLASSTANSAIPVNNYEQVLKNMGRRFSLSAMNPIKKDSANSNNSSENENNATEKNKENIIKSSDEIELSERENNEARNVNNYVQITNVVNMNTNNLDANSLPPKIQIEIKTDFIRDSTALYYSKKNRPSRSSITLTHKQLKFITNQQQKSSAEASKPENLNKESLSILASAKPRQEISLENLISESKTSKIVTEAITKKIIILILSILVVLPILEDSFYASDDILSYSILSKYISNFFSLFGNDSIPNYLPQKLNNSLWDVILNEADEYFPIVNITSYQSVLYINETWANYTFRKTELSTAVSPDSNMVILYSLIFDNQTVALLNILKTVCLCILVTIATVYFESDVKTLVLDPLEVMIEIVDKVAKDPIKAKNFENLESGMKTTISKLKSEEDSAAHSNKNDSKRSKKKLKAEEEYEVKIIQNAIMKISALLAIGIGEAGNEIIKENLSNYNDLDPMVKGRKKIAIFGFCDIRSFPLVNEALQEHTMLFLNEIADIVHSSVDLFGGSTNKNIGDAFLMVWKLPDELYEKLPQMDTKDTFSPMSLKALEPTARYGGKAEYGIKNFYGNKINENNGDNCNYKKIGNEEEVNLTTHKNFIKQSTKNKNDLKNSKNNYSENNYNYNNNTINSNTKNYKNHKQQQQQNTKNTPKAYPEVTKIADSSVFSFLKIIAKINRDLRILSYRKNSEIKKKIADFKVNMGFGLHMGWAIEGAIGSSYKIDASYLSPNVNMAARLEAATRQYGVSILISGPMHDLLSESVKHLCRLIDVVTVKGSIKPVKFYTIDVNENLKPSKKLKKSVSDKHARLKLLHKKKQLKISIETSNVADAMMKKKYFRQMLKKARSPIFNLIFKEGFDAYISGDWVLAGKKFDKCLSFYEKDGPTKTLLSFIKENNFQAPANWEGFRALTSK